MVCATNLPCTAKFNQNILVYFALNLRDFAVFAHFAFTMSQFISQILCLAVVQIGAIFWRSVLVDYRWLKFIFILVTVFAPQICALRG